MLAGEANPARSETGSLTKEKPKGGKVGRLWTRHGGGYYALIAVGTFIYLEVVDLWSGISNSDTVQDFMVSELVTFGIETVMNTIMASFWPFYWYVQNGLPGLGWFVGGYFVWTFLLAVLLNRREKEMRRELGL